MQDFLRFIITNKAITPFAAKFAAAVERVKADAKERNIYMTLAMDLQIYVEKNKDEWYAEGKADGKIEGKVEASRDIALRFLHNGISPEQVALGTGLSLEEIHQLRNVQ